MCAICLFCRGYTGVRLGTVGYLYNGMDYFPLDGHTNWILRALPLYLGPDRSTRVTLVVHRNALRPSFLSISTSTWAVFRLTILYVRRRPLVFFVPCLQEDFGGLSYAEITYAEITMELKSGHSKLNLKTGGLGILLFEYNKIRSFKHHWTISWLSFDYIISLTISFTPFFPIDHLYPLPVCSQVTFCVLC